jgi:hypothetical protein
MLCRLTAMSDAGHHVRDVIVAARRVVNRVLAAPRRPPLQRFTGENGHLIEYQMAASGRLKML